MIDVACRRVLTHKTATTREPCHAFEILEQAMACFGLPKIVNTDQGSQFTSSDFTAAVLDRDCKRSMEGCGAWRDNVFVERLWRSVKCERVDLQAYDSTAAARADIAHYFIWYNMNRPHSNLRDETPEQPFLNPVPGLAQAL